MKQTEHTSKPKTVGLSVQTTFSIVRYGAESVPSNERIEGCVPAPSPSLYLEVIRSISCVGKTSESL